MESGYQITRERGGFKGTKTRTLRWAMLGLRRRVRGVKGPFTVDNPDHPKPDPAERDRDATLTLVQKRMTEGAIGLRLVIRGSAYDAPAYVIRKVAVVPRMPLVENAKKYLHERYVFAAIFPPVGDCSALTLVAAKNVYGIDLPHSAFQQADSPLMAIFHDPDALEPDDFIFYVYGGRPDLPRGAISHVALNIDGRDEIGARPSAGGVEITRIDWPAVVSFGRLRH